MPAAARGGGAFHRGSVPGGTVAPDQAGKDDDPDVEFIYDAELDSKEMTVGMRLPSRFARVENELGCI